MNDRTRDNYDLNQLLHPAQAFERPSDVLGDPDLTLNEKRAILASWASDACAVDAAPDLRSNARGAPVRFDDIMDSKSRSERNGGSIPSTHHTGLR
jgi:hypothetical protein